MKNYFFIGMAVLAIVAGIGYFLWKLSVTLYYEWRLRRDVSAIKATNAQRRAKRAEANAKRLDNGCQHEFGSYLGGFPPNACTHCGLEREKPAGSCDHVWKMSNEPIPTSYCQTCGKKFGGKIFERTSRA
jgi:hypothetical protein